MKSDKDIYDYPTKKAAIAKATELLKLFPKGWTFYVHENMGWHFRFEKKGMAPGLVTVYYSYGVFWCLVANSLALFNGHQTHYSKDPMKALKRALKHAQASLDDLTKQVQDSKKVFE